MGMDGLHCFEKKNELESEVVSRIKTFIDICILYDTIFFLATFVYGDTYKLIHKHIWQALLNRHNSQNIPFLKAISVTCHTQEAFSLGRELGLSKWSCLG